MLANYILNEDNTVKMLIYAPLDSTKPMIKLEEHYTVKLGLDKIIDGELVKFDGADPALETVLKNSRILELKKLLADSDYQCLKHADGELTDEEYESIKAQRHAWRVEINELEN